VIVQNIQRIVKAIKKGNPGLLGVTSEGSLAASECLCCRNPGQVILLPVPSLSRRCSIKHATWQFQFASV